MAEPVTAVRVGVLGPLTAVVGGVPTALGGPQQRSVLARLLLAGGEVVSTDRLVNDLWEGEPPPKALASLQVHVSHLRRALEPGRGRRAAADVLVSAPPGYRVQLPTDAVDAWRFADLVERGLAAGDPAARRALLHQALGCWSGSAYADVQDASWAAPEIARLTELRWLAVEGRADADLALGRAADVVPALHRHVHDHPAREDAVRLLALALYRSGRQADALTALRRARTHLADELGLDPGRALVDLEAAVLAQAPALDAGIQRPAVQLAPAEGPVDADPPAELAALLAYAAPDTTARVVWITGEAGAGKTTLVDAVADDLARRGRRVLRGHCPEVDGAPPGWPWGEIGRELGITDAPASAFWQAHDLADRVRSVDGPVLVVLDDVHRADGLTLQLLRQVVDQLADSPVLVLATYRGSEDGDALAATRAALATATAGHVAVRGLDDGRVAALAARHGLTAPTPEVVALLRERTDGNPLFVRELARLIAAEGTGAGRTGVPTGVGDVLRRRVGRLPGSSVTVLRQAAVLGRDVDVDLLASLTGRSADDLLDDVEAAVLAGLLEEPAPGRVRFTHALVRDTLYADTPLLRRSRWHAAALRAWQAAGGADAATLAHHAVAAATPGTAADAVPLVVAAAREAQARDAWADAARQWATAVRVHRSARPGAEDERALLDLLLPAITAHARAGDTVSARALLTSAVRIARAGGDRELLVAVLTAWDAPLVWTVRDDGARHPELLDPLLELLETPAGADLPVADRCRLLAALVREAEGLDDARTQDAGRRAHELAQQLVDAPARLRCEAWNTAAWTALGPDRAAQRRDVAEAYLAVAEETGQADHVAVAHWLLFLAAAAETDLLAAREHVDLSVVLAGSGQLGHVLGVVQIFDAALLVLAGRTAEGRARYEEVAARLHETGSMNGGLIALVGRFVAGFAAGDLTPVLADVTWLATEMPGSLPEAVVLGMLDAGRVAQARAAWEGRRPVARDYFWLASTTLRLHAAVRLGEAADVRSGYTELLPWSDRVAGLDSGTLVVGPVADALAAAAEAMGDGAAAATHRQEAEALCRRVRDQLNELGVSSRTPAARAGGTAAPPA